MPIDLSKIPEEMRADIEAAMQAQEKLTEVSSERDRYRSNLEYLETDEGQAYYQETILKRPKDENKQMQQRAAQEDGDKTGGTQRDAVDVESIKEAARKEIQAEIARNKAKDSAKAAIGDIPFDDLVKHAMEEHPGVKEETVRLQLQSDASVAKLVANSFRGKQALEQAKQAYVADSEWTGSSSFKQSAGSGLPSSAIKFGASYGLTEEQLKAAADPEMEINF